MARIPEQSDKLKVLKGYRKSVKNGIGLAPISRLWDVPTDLDERAAEFYKRIGEILVEHRVLTNLDEFTFIWLAKMHSRLRRLEDTLSVEGDILINAKGKQYLHPAGNAHHKLFSSFRSLAERFGLTPYDRRKIDLKLEKLPDDDPDGRFFGL
jgi:P27 family predicted phage terminase small subunit